MLGFLHCLWYLTPNTFDIPNKFGIWKIKNLVIYVHRIIPRATYDKVSRVLDNFSTVNFSTYVDIARKISYHVVFIDSSTNGTISLSLLL